MIVRVNKTNDYTTMSNVHLKDRRLSLKAKGLLSVVLSLPPDWKYSIEGLAAISKEKETSIKSALDELKDNGYFLITKKMPNETKSGRIEYEWDFYERPHIEAEQPKQEAKKQGLENLTLESLPLENLTLESQGQLNTDVLNTNILNTKEQNTNNIVLANTGKRKSNQFVPPTLEEVQNYCRERNSCVDPVQFYEYFTTGEWKDSRGNQVKNWKQKLITWEKLNQNKPSSISYPKSSGNPFDSFI